MGKTEEIAWTKGLEMGKDLGLGEAARLAREEYRATRARGEHVAAETLRKFAIKLGKAN